MSVKSKFIIILKHEKARTKSNARSNEGIILLNTDYDIVERILQ